jgi:transposase InsO family protein
VGPIKGAWLSGEDKTEILAVVDEAKDKGVSNRRSCELLMINRRRVVRWKGWRRQGRGLENEKPGPKHALHALLPVERHQVVTMARSEEYADLSHRMLAVTGWEEGRCVVSFSSAYRILVDEGLMSMRGVCRRHNGRSVPPERREVTGPNQRWCWDISYLPTFERRIYLYLYLLLDEWSRKAIHWLVSWHQNQQEALQLLEGGLVQENILDLPEGERPEVMNDRGSPMKAKTVRRLFEEHEMPQIFARPRTPNDNPFVESAFGTVKTAPEYPGRFRDQEDGQRYFDRFFPWYNTEHYHSGIDYVTPEQAHTGKRDEIVARRREQMQQQIARRKETNRRLLTMEEAGPVYEATVVAG